MGSIKYLVNITFIALFSIAVIMYAVNFGLDNGNTINLANESEFSTINNNQVENIRDMQSDADGGIVSILSSSRVTDEKGTEYNSGEPFKIGLFTGWNMINNSIDSAFSKIFGDDENFGIIFTALASLMVLIGVLYAWKTFKGSPD